MSVAVVATIRPAQGRTAEVVEVLRASVARVTHEEQPDCERYELHADDSTGDLVMVERWADEAALARHAAGPALAALGAGLDGMLAAPIEVRRLRVL
ncbi:MAG TPA: antibiotic biosynthesis monooxygenase [Cellulomonas sp.]